MRKILRVIKAHQARNSDGSWGGWVEGTPDGERWVEEEEIHFPDGRVRFQNRWFPEGWDASGHEPVVVGTPIVPSYIGPDGTVFRRGKIVGKVRPDGAYGDGDE